MLAGWGYSAVCWAGRDLAPWPAAGWSAHKAAAAMRAGWAGDWAAEQGYCPVIVIRLRDAAHNSHTAPSQRSQLTGQGDVVIHVRPKKDKTFCLVFRLSNVIYLSHVT